MKPSLACAVLLSLTVCTFGQAQSAPAVGANVNMVSGITLANGDPFLTKQNESTIAVSSVNSLNLLGGSNDYRLIPLSTADAPGEASSATTSADAWVSRYWSTDGGRTWRSKVIPGCPLAIAACSGNTALQGLTFASDPTIRSGPYGSFFYSFVAGIRGASSGSVVAVQRWFDMNNTVAYGADPFLQDKLNIVATGAPGHLLDKTWNIADVSREWNEDKYCALPTSPTPVPAFNVYVSYSDFVGDSTPDPRATAYVATSTDCGLTFRKPQKISGSIPTNQGTTMAIDPQDGTVYVFWRQIYTTANNSPDAIYFAKSTDEGSDWTSPRLLANNVPFFEQETGAGRFRAEAFTTAAVSVSGGISRIHVAWAQRGVGPMGAARIVMITSSDRGATWTVPTAVDNNFQNQTAVPYAGGPGAISWSDFNPFNLNGYGHQYQPALIAVGPKLTLIWQDQRLDHTTGMLQCPTTPGHSIRDCTEHRTPKLNSQGGSDLPADVFTEDITDATQGLKVRHSVDVFGGQAMVSDNNPVFTVTRVSQFPFGSAAVPFTGTRPRLAIQQLRFNLPNLPIFSQFSLPFDGDYNDVAAQSIKATGSRGRPYAWNMDSNSVVHGTWTSNQDVVAPKDGNWAHATPLQLISGTSTILNPDCLPGQEGVQNQNVYTSTLFTGIDAYAVANSKYLNASTARQFNIVVQNGTSQTISVSLAIVPPPSGTAASFKTTAAVSSLGVAPSPSLHVLPFSSITRTVWVTSSNPGATITVNVVSGATIIPVLLNPDSSATILTANQATDIINNNQGDLTVVNTRLSNADLTNVKVTDNTLSDNTLSDNTLSDNTLSDNTLSDNTLSDNTLSDNTLSDNTLSDNTLSDNTLSDNTLSDNTLSDNTLSDAGLTDATFTLFNNGTTDVAMNLKALMRGQGIPAGYDVELIIHKTYNTQMPDLTKRFANNATCGYSKSSQSIPVLNASNPIITSTTALDLTQISDEDPDAYTLSLLPQEVGRVVFRLVKNGNAIDENQAEANEFGSNGVKPVALNASSTIVPIPVIITTLTLPEVTADSTFVPGTQVQATGGFGTRVWTLDSSVDCSAYPGAISGLPVGLNLDGATGFISGTPTAPGLYCFRVKVSDSSTPHVQTDTQLLTMIVHGTQTVTFPVGPFVYGGSLLLSANSNVGLPIGYSTIGACTLSGTTLTATAGSGICTVNASQPGDQIYFPLNTSNQYALTPALLTVGVAGTQVYGGTGETFTPDFSASVFVSPETSAVVAGTLACSATVSSNSPVGAGYAVSVCSGLSAINYTINYSYGAFSVTAATSSVTVTCPTTPQPFTGFALNPCTAAYATIDGLSGPLTPSYSNNINAGTAGVSATYAGDANHSGNTGAGSFTISNPVSIQVSPATASIVNGTNLAFTATGTYSDGTTRDITLSVTWTSSSTTVATINGTGGATGVGAGISTIQAALGSISSGSAGSAVLTVGPPALKTITVTPANQSIPKGSSLAFTATGTYSDGSTKNITSSVCWSSSNTSVAQFDLGRNLPCGDGDADDSTAVGIGAGTITVMAVSGNVSGSTSLTVIVPPPTLKSISITPSSSSIAKGLTKQFTATGTYSDKSTQNLTTSVTWSSSNASVATVGSAALATGAGTGTASIRATVGGVTGTATLTVTSPTLVSISVTPVNPSISKGATSQFKATGTYTDSSTKDLTASVTWSSSSTSVATIKSTGVATGVKTGTTTIKAAAGSISGTTILTIL